MFRKNFPFSSRAMSWITTDGGDFLAWEYDVYEACCVAVHISKKPFQWGDTYVIDIVDPKDEVMALMLAIAIDAANCTK